MQSKTYFNWSSGKDAAFALYLLQQEGNHSVEKLLTSINSHHNRVSMHGLRRELLQKQINSIGLPYDTIELPEEPTMEDYNSSMKLVVDKLTNEGFTHAGFGDIFLEDLRKYREDNLATYNINCVFPLWKKDTKELLLEFLALGFRSVVICANANLLDESFVGREIDEQFIKDLPDNVDLCGENGEFHTFCFDGPIFNSPIQFTIGEKIYREYKAPKQDDICNSNDMGFWFCDLIPI